jgi:adhesin transport system outer membrane protein
LTARFTFIIVSALFPPMVFFMEGIFEINRLIIEEAGMLKNFLKGAVIVIAGILILGSGYVQAETLPEAIQQVLVTHPEIKSAAYNRQAKDQEVVQARGTYYPTLDASMTWGLLQQDKPSFANNRSWPSQSTVSLRQNLFRGGANVADVRRQEARVKSQAYLLQGTTENIALLTAKVYMNVLRTQELSELAKENLVNHERIGDQVKLRKQSGVDRGADLDQVLGRHALAQSNVVVTATNLRDARTDYQAVVGKLPDGLVAPPPINAPLPASLDDAEQIALKDYPVVKSAKADLEARKFQYSVAKRLLSPSFDIAADYNWTDDVASLPSSTPPIATGRRDYFSASAVLSFNVFNGLRNAGRIRETLYLVNEAEEILNNTQRQTVQSIRLSWEAYKAASERVAYLEEYAKATSATAEAFASQWNIGRRTMFDLLDTQAEAINAKSDLARAKYDKLYAEYRILSGMGKLVQSLGLQWPEESRVTEDVVVVAKETAPVKAEAAVAPQAAPPAAEPVKQVEPAVEKTSDGFMKADKDGFIRSVPVKAEPVAAPPAAAPAAAVPQPEPVAAPPAAAPQASEPAKQAAQPAAEKTSDGFIKADKDGFIRSR